MGAPPSRRVTPAPPKRRCAPLQITTRKTGEAIRKREITVTDDSGASVRLTIWREKADNFNNPVGTPILIKGAKVRHPPHCTRSPATLLGRAAALDPCTGHGLVATVTYPGGGGGVQRPKKKGLCTNRPPVSGPFDKFHFFPGNLFLMWMGGGVAGYGRPVDRGAWTAKTVKRPRQQPAHPQYANYWASLTRKRHTMPHSAQPQQARKNFFTKKLSPTYV